MIEGVRDTANITQSRRRLFPDRSRRVKRRKHKSILAALRE